MLLKCMHILYMTSRVYFRLHVLLGALGHEYDCLCAVVMFASSNYARRLLVGKYYQKITQTVFTSIFISVISSWLRARVCVVLLQCGDGSESVRMCVCVCFCPVGYSPKIPVHFDVQPKSAVSCRLSVCSSVMPYVCSRILCVNHI